MYISEKEYEALREAVDLYGTQFEGLDVDDKTERKMDETHSLLWDLKRKAHAEICRRQFRRNLNKQNDSCDPPRG